MFFVLFFNVECLLSFKMVGVGFTLVRFFFFVTICLSRVSPDLIVYFLVSCFSFGSSVTATKPNQLGKDGVMLKSW